MMEQTQGRRKPPLLCVVSCHINTGVFYYRGTPTATVWPGE